jgi:hypothetical protein
MALARVEAVAAGRAQPIARVRHVYLSPRPLVCVPLALAGEAAAPLAMMLGTQREQPRVLVVPQPRDRQLRQEFVAELAAVVEEYDCEEPQLIVPNRAGIDFLRLLGRSTRFHDGDRVGRWLTHFTDRADCPGSAALLAATEALTLHWATGQSAMEDANLATVLAWIEGRPAEEVEGLNAGPQTDPVFDNTVLGPLIDAYDRGDLEAAPAIGKVLCDQLDVTWRHIWHAVEILRLLPEASTVAERWLWDVAAYTAFAGQQDEEPQPVRDGAVAAAVRLDQWERARVRYDAQRAFDDPLAMAAYRLTGEAFRCVVVKVEPDRKEGRKLRPRVTVVADSDVDVRVGETVASPSRRGQVAEVVGVDGRTVMLMLTNGMGRGVVPAAGSVPEVGEDLVYTTLNEAFRRPATFPDPESTPWTHGGHRIGVVSE